MPQGSRPWGAVSASRMILRGCSALSQGAEVWICIACESANFMLKAVAFIGLLARGHQYRFKKLAAVLVATWGQVMRTRLLLGVVLFLFTLCLRARINPTVEIFGGYSFPRANSAHELSGIDWGHHPLRVEGTGPERQGGR